MEQMKSYGAIVAVLGGELGDTFDQIADYVYSMDKEWNDMQYSAIIGLSDSFLDIILQTVRIWMQIHRDT